MRIAPTLLAGVLLTAPALAGAPPAPEPTEAAEPTPEEPAPAATEASTDPDPPAAEPVELQLDPAASTVYARLHPAGAVSALAGHEHVITASEVAGTATWHPDDPGASQIAVEVDVSGLVPDSDAMRDAVGLEGTLSDGQRGRIHKHMLAEGQLWAERYGLVRFESTGVERPGDCTLSVTGEFTLRGETHPVTVPIDWQTQGDGYRARGQFTIHHTDFGFEPYSAVLGAVRNANPIDIHLDIALEPR